MYEEQQQQKEDVEIKNIRAVGKKLNRILEDEIETMSL